jgi:redox-sensitive bicupin YhaK (pirin superfamily)
MHGYQIWVALPKDKEEMDPTFEYLQAKDIPSCEQDGLTIKVAAGSGFGLTSPLLVHSPLFMVDVYTNKDNKLDIKDQLSGEIAIVVVKGQASIQGEPIKAGNMLISKTDDECFLNLSKGTQLLLFGGEPLPEPRHLMWNFVSSSKERLNKAREDWINKRFPKVKGDNSYIDFP